MTGSRSLSKEKSARAVPAGAACKQDSCLKRNAANFFIVRVKKILFTLAVMSTFSFPNPHAYGQNLPSSDVPAAQTAKKSANSELLNLITLADLTLYKNPQDVSAAAKRMLGKTDIITDEKLQITVRLSLAEAAAEPERFPEIRARHFKKVSERFTDIADEARKDKNYRAALNAAQIAARANPKNLRARLILSSLVDAYGGDTATAIKLMHAGLKFIDLDAPVTYSYFSKYFELLSDMQQDNVAADQAQKILKSNAVPADTRRIVALAGAFAQYNRGNYTAALDLIARENLAESVQGRILKARCFFADGRRDAAIDLLRESVSQFPSDKREPIFNQLSRFFSESGDFASVLDVSRRQLEENANALGPRLRMLFAYKKLGNDAAFSAELERVFADFSLSQGALVALANFAAEQGSPELALRCMSTARERNFDTSLFVAAVVEALVAAKRPVEAIDAYSQATSANAQIFDEFQTVISAVLASAYAEAASAETSPEKAAPLREHSELLLSQFLENPAVRPENALAAIRHFRRIGRNDIASRIATASLKRFPWHSQIRADWISLQLADADALSQLNLPAEVRVLAEMRRPEPAIWHEILAWLDKNDAANAAGNISFASGDDSGWGAALDSSAVSAEESAALRALVTPLAK